MNLSKSNAGGHHVNVAVFIYPKTDNIPTVPVARAPGSLVRALTTVGNFLFGPWWAGRGIVERIKEKLEEQDYSSEIAMELSQLIALGELIRMADDPDGIRNGFFIGLGDLIEGAADRINKMLFPTYDKCYQQGKDSATRPQAAPEGGAA